MRKFFTNRDVNHIFLHKLIYYCGERIGWIFGPIFMLQLGYGIDVTLAIWSGIFAMRLPIRYLYLRSFKFFGLTRAVCFGLVCYAGAMCFLPHIKERPDLIPWFLLVFSVAMTFYYTAFHTIFGLVGDTGNRGKHMSMINTLSTILSALIPLLSATIVGLAGFETLFSISAILMVIAAIPLWKLKTPTPKLLTKHSEKQKAAVRWIMKYHFFYAIKEYASIFLWRFVVFTMVGSLMMFGTVLTAGLIFFAILQLFVGHYIDKGRGYLMLKIGTAISLVQVLIRSAIPGVPAAMAVTEGLSIGNQLMTQADVNFYNQGKTAESYFHYIYWAEVAWDASVTAILLTIAGMVHIGFSLQMIMLILSPIGLLGLYWINLQAKNATS
ncbi:MAG: hypothetical protein EYC62_02845 [Alphaproteobacteria bacterium]|nr:MAG: hypothetical protein EYC62_02845 [Alphaproteobacteria bacterium]